MMKTLIVVLGPTGVGKTELCLSLAEHLSIPIINADSRQIFADSLSEPQRLLPNSSSG